MSVPDVNVGVHAVVLNGSGVIATPLANGAHVGDRLRMKFNTSSQAMNNADMAITGSGWILHNGVANPNGNWSNVLSGTGPFSVNPRTIMAWSSSKFFMVVCDGRGCGGLAAGRRHGRSEGRRGVRRRITEAGEGTPDVGRSEVGQLGDRLGGVAVAAGHELEQDIGGAEVGAAVLDRGDQPGLLEQVEHAVGEHGATGVAGAQALKDRVEGGGDAVAVAAQVGQEGAELAVG